MFANLNQTYESNIQQVVYELTHRARNMMDRVIKCEGIKDNSGSCLYASVLLEEMLNRFSDVDSVRIRGGDGFGDGGYCDENGELHGHYWIEIYHSYQHLIIDITADQFGDNPVKIIPLEVSKSTYIPGNQYLVDQHIRNIKGDFKERLQYGNPTQGAGINSPEPEEGHLQNKKSHNNIGPLIDGFSNEYYIERNENENKIVHKKNGVLEVKVNISNDEAKMLINTFSLKEKIVSKTNTLVTISDG